jgi:hypothetical protein
VLTLIYIAYKTGIKCDQMGHLVFILLVSTVFHIRLMFVTYCTFTVPLLHLKPFLICVWLGHLLFIPLVCIMFHVRSMKGNLPKWSCEQSKPDKV